MMANNLSWSVKGALTLQELLAGATRRGAFICPMFTFGIIRRRVFPADDHAYSNALRIPSWQLTAVAC